MGKFALGIRQRQRHRGPAHQRESGVRCAFLAPGRQRTDATSQLCHDSVIILTQTIHIERYCRCIVVACTTAFMGEGGRTGEGGGRIKIHAPWLHRRSKWRRSGTGASCPVVMRGRRTRRSSRRRRWNLGPPQERTLTAGRMVTAMRASTSTRSSGRPRQAPSAAKARLHRLCSMSVN